MCTPSPFSFSDCRGLGSEGFSRGSGALYSQNTRKQRAKNEIKLSQFKYRMSVFEQNPAYFPTFALFIFRLLHLDPKILASAKTSKSEKPTQSVEAT